MAWMMRIPVSVCRPLLSLWQVRLLLAAGADPALVAAGGGTARSAARTAGHPECDALLAGAGAPEPPPPRPLAPAAAPAAVRVTPLAAWVPDKYAVNGTGAAVVDGAIPPAELAWLEELARAQAGRFAKRARQTADAGRLSQALNTDAERAHLFDLDGCRPILPIPPFPPLFPHCHGAHSVIHASLYVCVCAHAGAVTTTAQLRT